VDLIRLAARNAPPSLCVLLHQHDSAAKIMGEKSASVRINATLCDASR
jgi:hypothetical protein